DEAADAVFAAGDADNDFISYDERRDGEGVALGVIGGGDIPEHIAGGSIESGQEKTSAENGKAAVDVSAAGANFFGKGASVRPEAAAGASVESEGGVFLRGDVHDAVDDEGSVFKVAGDRSLEDPLSGEVGDVFAIELGERAEAVAIVGAGVLQPVGGSSGR